MLGAIGIARLFAMSDKYGNSIYDNPIGSTNEFSTPNIKFRRKHLRKGPNDEVMRYDSCLKTLYIHVEVCGPHALADRVIRHIRRSQALSHEDLVVALEHVADALLLYIMTY